MITCLHWLFNHSFVHYHHLNHMHPITSYYKCVCDLIEKHYLVYVVTTSHACTTIGLLHIFFVLMSNVTLTCTVCHGDLCDSSFWTTNADLLLLFLPSRRYQALGMHAVAAIITQLSCFAGFWLVIGQPNYTSITCTTPA